MNVRSSTRATSPGSLRGVEAVRPLLGSSGDERAARRRGAGRAPRTPRRSRRTSGPGRAGGSRPSARPTSSSLRLAVGGAVVRDRAVTRSSPRAVEPRCQRVSTRGTPAHQACRSRPSGIGRATLASGAASIRGAMPMTVSAYILIQTEVGKASGVVDAVRGLAGRRPGRRRDRPVRRDPAGRGRLDRRARPHGRVADPARRRHHPHPDLPRRAPLTTRVSGRRAGQRWRPRRGRGAAWRSIARSMRRSSSCGVREARRLPQPRVHRDRREARDRVQLVDDEHAVARRRKKSTRAIASHRHASNARTASARTVGGLGVGRAAPGTSSSRLAVLVLVGVVVEVGAGHDLARAATPPAGRRRARRPRSRGRSTASSARIHSSYVERVRDRGVELGARRAPSTRRPTSPCSPASRSTGARARPRPGRRTRRRSWPSRSARYARLRQPGGREHALHHDLVHADRGAEHARADVRQAGELEQALHRAVFAVRAVQQREHDVDAERRTPTSTRHDSGAPGSLGSSHRLALDGERGGQRRRARLEHARRASPASSHATVGRDRRPARPRSARDRAPRATATAVTRDTSCSADRPPNSSITRTPATVATAPSAARTCSTARMPSPMMNRPPSPYASSIQPRAFHTYRYEYSSPTVMNATKP